MDQAAGAPLGYIRDRLAGWSTAGLLHDVTVGVNSTPTYPKDFQATSGYDIPTGWGTPDIGALIHSINPNA